VKTRYSLDFSPAAPVLPVLIRLPGSIESKRLEGKVDSGADMCAIPEDVIADLDLPPVRMVRAAGFAGVLQEVMLYHCAIELADRRFEHVEAVATRRRYAIIGRNVLRHLVLKLDGPNTTLTIGAAKSRLTRRSRKA